MSFLERYGRKLRDGGWVVSANLVRQILAIAFMAVLAWKFDKATVGRFQLIISAVALSSLFVFPGLENATIQSVARGFIGTFRKALLLRFAGSWVGAIALAVYGLTFPGEAQGVLRPALLAAAALFPFAVGLTGWTEYQAGVGQFNRNAMVNMAGSILGHGGMIVLLLVTSPALVWLIVVSKGVLAVLNVAMVAHVLRRVPRTAPPEPDAIRYGVHTSGYLTLNAIGNEADKLLIFYCMSPADLAVFTIAEKLPEIVKKYIQSVRIILIPGFSRKAAYTAELNKKINLASLVLSIGILFIIFAVTPWLVPLLFSNAYDDSVLYCQLILGTLLVGQAAQTKMTFVLAKLDATGVRNIVVGSNLVRILASVVLVPLLGIMGAVLSTALYRLSTAAVVWWQLRSRHMTPSPLHDPS